MHFVAVDISITASSGLTKDDVERMVREAEANAAEDARWKQEIELRNQTDSLVYTTERALAEHGAKLSDAERRAVEQALNDAREALEADDMERIRRAQESLNRVSATLADARRRENLEMDLPLWPWQAVRGASVRVETPDGPVMLAAARPRRLLRLRRDLGVNLTGTAIIVDLLERLDRVEAELIRLRTTR